MPKVESSEEEESSQE